MSRAAQPGFSDRLVGRGDFEAPALDLLRSLLTGDRQVTVLVGPAGSGRSALLGEIADLAGAHQVRVVGSGTLESIYNTLLDERAPAGPAADPRRGRTEVQPVRNQARLAETLLGTLGAALGSTAHPVPVLLLAEDLDTWDETELVVLSLVLHQFARRPVGLVASCSPRWHALADEGDWPARTALPWPVTLEVGPLSRPAMSGYVTRRVGAAPDSATLGALQHLCAGNAAALCDLVDQWIANRTLIHQNHTAVLLHPHARTLRPGHSLLTRLIEGPPARRYWAGLVAALGRLPLGVLDLVTGQLGVDLDTAATALDGLLADGTLRREEQDMVTHAVPALANSLAAEVSEDLAQRGHAAVAVGLWQRWAAGGLPALPELAEHIVLGGTDVLGQSPEILRLAAQQLDPEEHERIGEWLWRALDLLAPRDPRRAAVVLELADPLGRQGRWAGLADLCEAVLGEQPDLEPAVRTRLLTTLVGALDRLGRHQQALRLLDRHEVRDTGEAVLRVRRAYSLYILERFEESGALCQELMRDEEIPVRTRSRFAIGAIMAVATAAPKDEVDRVLREIHALRLDLHTDPAILPQLREYADWGDFTGAEQLLRGHPVPQSGGADGAVMHEVRRAYLAGEWDLALTTGRRALADSRSAPGRYVLALVRAGCARILVQRDDVTAATEMLRPATAEVVAGNLVAHVQLTLALAAGRPDQAAETARAALRRAGDLGYRSGLGRLQAGLAEAQVLLGDRAAARAVLPELDEFARHSGGREDEFWAHFAHALAESDPEHAAAAVRTGAGGDPHSLARALLLAANLGVDTEDNLRRAYRSFRELGADRLRREAKNAMRAHGIAVPRARAQNANTTALHRRLINLVLAGKTNRQLASALGISEKTVESHLTRIYANTGCHSRVELIAIYRQSNLS